MTGPDIRAALEKLSMDQGQLANILDVTPEHVSRMVNGKKAITPSNALLIRAMLAFGLPDTWP